LFWNWILQSIWQFGYAMMPPPPKVWSHKWMTPNMQQNYKNNNVPHCRHIKLSYVYSKKESIIHTGCHCGAFTLSYQTVHKKCSFNNWLGHNVYPSQLISIISLECLHREIFYWFFFSAKKKFIFKNDIRVIIIAICVSVV